jgi:hypothetical protein
MEEKTYNGWTNYETWVVSLWLDNDQGSYEYWREQAREKRREAPECRQVRDEIWSKAQAEKFTLADQLKDEIEEASPLVEASLYSDLLSAALSEVNWQEIAGSMLEALPEDEPDEITEEDTEKQETIDKGDEKEGEERRQRKTNEPAAEGTSSSPFGPVIYSYTRAQAIADGVLVDVSKIAQEAGIKYHTAVSSAVWGKYIEVPQAVSWQDEVGRLWDILFLLSLAMRQHLDESELIFSVAVQNDRRGPRPVELKAVCGPGDDAEPVITIMLPIED